MNRFGHRLAKNATNLGEPGMLKNVVGTNSVFKVHLTHHNKTSKLALVPKFKCPLANNLSTCSVILAILLCLSNLGKSDINNGE